MDRKIEETVDGIETNKAAIRQLKNEIKKGEEEMVGMINEELINIWFKLSLFCISYYKFWHK